MAFSRLSSAAAIALSCFCITGSAFADPHGRRSWTPEDSVRLRYYSYSQDSPSSLDWGDATDPIVVNEHGSRFFVVTHRGDLENDAEVYELSVFEADALREALERGSAPRSIVLSRETRSNHPAILDAQWVDDGERILFFGVTDDQEQEGFIFDIHTRSVRQLTEFNPRRLPRVAPRMHYNGGSVIFQDSEARTRAPHYPFEAPPRDPVEYGGGLRPSPLLETGDRRVWVRYRGARARELERQGPSDCAGSSSARFGDAWVSPDGRFALIEDRGDNGTCVSVLDMRRATASQILDDGQTAFGDNDGGPGFVSWSPNSAQVAFVRASKVYIYNTANEALEVVVNHEETSPTIAWREDGNTLLLFSSGEAARAVVRSSGRWILRPTSEVRSAITQARTMSGSAVFSRGSRIELRNGIVVTLREHANHPPELIASTGQREVSLIADDPVLTEVALRSWEPFRWSDADGTPLEALLLMPSLASGAPPPPLIIQAYHVVPDYFQPDGSHLGTVEAAQALVARGFAVLQMEAWLPDDPNVLEGQTFVRRLDAAVDALTARGLIDRERVGLTGFSRGGYLVFYAQTHPGRTRLAAVVINDSYTASYPALIAAAASEPFPSVRMEPGGDAYPPGTFWRDRQVWLEHETSFHADRIASPTLRTANGPYEFDQLSAMRETVGLARATRRPFDFLIFPEGEHTLQRPRERLALIEVTLDWLSFWMQGLEDSDPTKVAQYERWRRLRDDWRLQRAWEAAGNPTGSPPSSDFSTSLTH